eukprot:TRINITY_DN28925_c0_g1_i1.p2 TRINITY_DN28925_c0_g1~~TRINITY_DN28925_c0_g1_i1.p2  ORF type:complete len:53 (-),score=5.87 TRINITY_DN28925_c0_g1_i1:26-184(-)
MISLHIVVSRLMLITRRTDIVSWIIYIIVINLVVHCNLYIYILYNNYNFKLI